MSSDSSCAGYSNTAGLERVAGEKGQLLAYLCNMDCICSGTAESSAPQRDSLQAWLAAPPRRPTPLQAHTMACWAERLLSLQGRGGRSLFRHGSGLGDALLADVAAFHASLPHWPLLLDLPETIAQVGVLAVAPSLLLHVRDNTLTTEHTPRSICFTAGMPTLLLCTLPQTVMQG